MTQHEFDNFMRLVEVSAIAAAPVIGNLPDDLKADLTNLDQLSPEMQAANVVEFRTIRTFASFIAGTAFDAAKYATFWPAIPLTGGGPVLTPGAPAAMPNPSAPRAPSVLLEELRALLASDMKQEAIGLVKTAVMGG